MSKQYNRGLLSHGKSISSFNLFTLVRSTSIPRSLLFFFVLLTLLAHSRQDSQQIRSEKYNWTNIIHNIHQDKGISSSYKPSHVSGVDEVISGSGSRATSGLSFYRVLIGESIKKYLFVDVSVNEQDQWQQVRLSVYPLNANSPLITCNVEELDSCYLNRNLLSSIHEVLVAVKCEDDCKYTLRLHWSDIEHLKIKQTKYFKFGESLQQIYHVELQEEEEFDELRIYLVPRVTRRPFDRVKIYGKYGHEGEPTSKSYDFESINLWDDGAGVFLKNTVIPSEEFTILIVGQAETTYELKMQLVQEGKHQVKLGDSVSEYLSKGSQKKYHFSFPTVGYDEYSLSFSTMSGNLSLFYSLDEEGNHEYQSQPYEYMRDSEEIITQQAAKIFHQGLYLNVRTDKGDATFFIRFIARNVSQPIRLQENVYSFIPLKSSHLRIAYFTFADWIGDKQSQNALIFNVHMLSIDGHVVPEFRICTQDLIKCTDTAQYLIATKVLSTKMLGSVGKKINHQLSIPDIHMNHINEAEKQGIIVIVLNSSASASTLALEFLNANKVLTLREGRPVEEWVGQGAYKIYKLANSDRKATEILVHLNEVAGTASIYGIINKFGTDNDKANTNIVTARPGQITVYPQSHTLRFRSNLTNTIMVVVKGQSKAIYTLAMHLQHLQGRVGNIITMSEDVSYTVRVPPNSNTVFEIHQIYGNSTFKFHSTRTVMACFLNSITNVCENNGTNSKANLLTEGILVLEDMSLHNNRIEIYNPFDDNAAEVTAVVHSGTFKHCERLKLGRVYSRAVSANQCYSFELSSYKPLEIYISKRSYSYVNVSCIICDNFYALENKQIVFINTTILEELCTRKTGPKVISFQWTVHGADATAKTNMHFVVQQSKGLIILPQGVAYGVQGRATTDPLKNFAFDLVQKKNTRVIIQSVRGVFVMYAKIVEQAKKPSSVVNAGDYSMMSNPQGEIFLTSKQIMDAGCIDCSLLVAVMSLDPEGTDVEFEVQFVQTVEELDERRVAIGDIDKNSYVYYSYRATADNQSVLFVLSDHNQQCGVLYLSQLEYPNSKQFLLQSATNELVLSPTQSSKRYFLSVFATEACSYSLSTHSSATQLIELQFNKQSHLKLQTGQIKYYIMTNSENNQFKLLSMAIYGEIEVWLNRTSDFIGQNPQAKLQLDYNKYTLKTDFKNLLLMPKQSVKDCDKCHYLIAVKALTDVESTLMLAYPSSIVPLVAGKRVFDYLPDAGDKLQTAYNRPQKIIIKVVVYLGKLQVDASYRTTRAHAVFMANQQTQSLLLDIKPQSTTQNNLQKDSIRIMFKALNNQTSYSFQLVSMTDQNFNAESGHIQLLKTGQPNYFMASQRIRKCFTGYHRGLKEEILFSVSEDHEKDLSTMLLLTKLGGVQTKFPKSQVQNMLLLSVPQVGQKQGKTTNSFEVCFKLQPLTHSRLPANLINSGIPKDDDVQVPIIVTQSSNINLLAPDSQIFMRKVSKFTVYSEGAFIMDVFECLGQAKITYALSLNGLEKAQSKSMQLLSYSEQSHSIRIDQRGPVFVEVQADQAIVRWAPYDLQQQVNIGYSKYSAQTLQYISHFQQIELVWTRLKNVSETKTNIVKLNYLIYLSSQDDKLHSAAQCSRFSSADVLAIPLPTYIQGPLEVRHKIEKSLLQQHFGTAQSIFFTVVADFALSLSQKPDGQKHNDKHEHYRFIYPRQQIPHDIFAVSQLEGISAKYLVVVVLVTAATVLLLVYFALQKWLRRCLQMTPVPTINEEEDQKGEDKLDVPPSSARKSMVMYVPESESNQSPQ